tara:strand:- start:3050 stop:4510 length:1461 start_codon:yes stop_codon:yes gene_type:complete
VNQQKIIIINNTETTDLTLNHHHNLSFDEIIELPPRKILQFKDLTYIANTLSSYFQQKVILAEFENNKKKYVLEYAKNTFDLIGGNTVIAFGLTLKNLAGSSIKDKVKNLFDADYLLKKLKYISEIYRAVVDFSYAENATYITNKMLKIYKMKQANISKFMKKTGRPTTDGSTCHTIDIEDKEKNKAKGIIANCKQFEEVAVYKNHHWLAITITCPPKFHIKPKFGRRLWDGILTPIDCNDFLNTIWINLKRKLGKLSISIYGHWCKEPNESMAIHMHILIYCSSNHIETIKKWTNHYSEAQFDKFDSDFIDGTSVKFDQGDCQTYQKLKNSKNATISQYINKHLLQCLNIAADKSVNNKRNKINNNGESDLDIYEKVKAHADKFSYKRYTFFGVSECLKVWRELKRFVTQQDIPEFVNEAFTELLTLAKNNNFKGFLTSKFKNIVSLLYKPVHGVNHNKHSELKTKIAGININGIDYVTLKDYLD